MDRFAARPFDPSTALIGVLTVVLPEPVAFVPGDLLDDLRMGERIRPNETYFCTIREQVAHTPPLS